jgi:hypothetical protein
MRAKVPKKLAKLRGYIGGFVNERMYARDERSYGVLLGLTMAYNLMCGQDEKIVRIPEFPTPEVTPEVAPDENPSA